MDRSTPQIECRCREGRGPLAVLTAEGGYSLLEVSVALAILVTVLAPAVGTALHVLARASVAPEVQAQAHGQRLMEETLQDRQYEPRTWMSSDNRWAFQRAISRQDDRVQITIRVWRARNADSPEEAMTITPLAEFVTTRLVSTGEEKSLEDAGYTPTLNAGT